MHSQTSWSPSAANKRRADKRKSGVYPTVNLVGVVAIFVALLVMFMTVTHSTHVKFSVDMAKAENAHFLPGARREDAMIIAVERDGRIYFNDEHVDADDVPKLIRESVQAGSEKKVYVRADARAKNGDVTRVFEEIQRSGITNVAILTEKGKPMLDP